jgi:LPXTG-motif cell wall-anchored protein
MIRLKALLVVLLVFGLGALAAQQTATPALKILMPRNGEKISTSFVDVRYELLTPAVASGTPEFLVQLDARDPVRTNDTQHTFTNLSAGQHLVSVEAVDANGTPILGTRTQVKFNVLPSPATQGTRTTPPGAASNAEAGGKVIHASMQEQRPADQKRSSEHLPNTGSSLPLLSVIGMGVLIGGIASALRTRHSDSRSR